MPPKLVDFLDPFDETPTVPVASELDNLLTPQRQVDFLAAVNHFPPEADVYETWLQVGQALHSADPKPNGMGFSLWQFFSQRGDRYDGVEILQAKWKSFKAQRGLTLNTAFHIFKQHGFDPRAQQQEQSQPRRPFVLPERLTWAAYQAAKPYRACVVEHFIYKDLGQLVAPGKTGKTTIALYIAIHVVLGRELWGFKVLLPGPVLYLSAEDSVQELAGTMRLLCEGLALTAAEQQRVLDNLRIGYIGEDDAQLLVADGRGFKVGPFADSVVAACKSFAPVLVLMDPISDFRLGDENDNLTGKRVARALARIRDGLDCTVLVLQHVSKESARNNDETQWASRGAGAFSDGMRQTLNITNLDATEWQKQTNGNVLHVDVSEQGLKLVRTAYKHAPPNLPPLFIKRIGYTYPLVAMNAPLAPTEVFEAYCSQVLTLVNEAVAKGDYPTQNSLQASCRGTIPRDTVRDAVAMLKSRGQLFDVPTGNASGPKNYLATTAQVAAQRRPKTTKKGASSG